MKALIKQIVPGFMLNWYRGNKTTVKPKARKIDEKFIGEKVLCPICQSKFSEFGPFGETNRKNARCHNCHSLERHRLLWLFLNSRGLLNSNNKIKLLHFGPEKVFYNTFSANKNIDYYPCDLFPELYTYDGKVKIHKIDITKIPFSDNYFDAILCNHVLEHIPDDALAMREIRRVLKKDGWAILQVPLRDDLEKTYEDFTITDPKARLKAFGQEDHVRLYGRDYKDRLEKNGFNVTTDNFVNSLSKEEIIRFGLMESELIFFCTKNDSVNL